jgi:hypothetical protein
LAILPLELAFMPRFNPAFQIAPAATQRSLAVARPRAAFRGNAFRESNKCARIAASVLDLFSDRGIIRSLLGSTRWRRHGALSVLVDDAVGHGAHIGFNQALGALEAVRECSPRHANC